MTKRRKVVLFAGGMVIAGGLVVIISKYGVATEHPLTFKGPWWTVTFIVIAGLLLWSLISLLNTLTPRTTSAVVRERIGRIQNTVATLQVAITTETTAIDAAMNELKRVLEQHERELEGVNTEVVRQREEAERYRALASLTKEQQDAFLKTLSQNQRGSYVAGFWVGVVSSAVVAVLTIVATHFFKL